MAERVSDSPASRRRAAAGEVATTPAATASPVSPASSQRGRIGVGMDSLRKEARSVVIAAGVAVVVGLIDVHVHPRVRLKIPAPGLVRHPGLVEVEVPEMWQQGEQFSP